MKALGIIIFYLLIFFYSAFLPGQNIYRDNFSSSSYSRNDGNSNFSSNWIEDEDDNSASNGYIRITENKLRFEYLWYENIKRSVNLSNATSATLSFNWQTVGLDNKEVLAVQISTNGTSFTTLNTFGGSNSGNYSIDISAYISSSTTIRFLSNDKNWNSNEYAYVDNFQISALFSYNEPPIITATGNQSYCPGVEIPIVESVSITDPDDNMMDKVFVQITSNYDNGKDVLALTGTHPGISSSWNASEGKLILTGPATLAAFETALKAVVFNTTATLTAGDGRNFSIVLNEANYLISTGHYYEYVPALGIIWTAAKDAAATRTFYGLQGYLATLTIADEAALLGKQSEGAGWIGASDVNEEGKWRWVTGPEAGTLFWNGGGNGNVTAPYNYANWNNGEPNNSGNEHYAHINAPGTGFDGSWNDLSNTGATSGDYQPKGYLVEYGGMPGDSPYPNISAVTSITVNSVAIAIQPVDQIAIVGTPVSFMVSANNADTYQWQVRTDGGASFVDIANGADYSGTKTNTLSIPNSNMTKNGYRYRVIVSNSNSDCPTITSDPAVLNVQIGTVITNKRITYRVKGN